MSRFVDTNILVYAHDAGAGDRHTVAAALVQQLWSGDPLPSISVQVLQELYVTLGRKKYDRDMIAAIIETYTAWPVVVTDVPLFRVAMAAQQRWKISFWDALIVEAARRAGAGELYTEDLSHGQNFDGVRIVNPFAAA